MKWAPSAWRSCGVERPLQERPEDRRLDLRPVRPRRLDQRRPVLGRQPRRAGVLEQEPVEPADALAHLADVAAGVHLAEEVRERVGQVVQVVGVGLQEPPERAVGDQARVLGEHGEEAPAEEAGDGLGVHRRPVHVDRPVERRRQHGEPVGECDRDAGLAPGGVERERVREHGRQRRTRLGVAEVAERDPVAGGVGERGVEPARAREVGVEVDHVAHVGDDQERRRGLGGLQVAGVALGLVPGRDHRGLPGARAARAVAGAECAPAGGPLGVGALLGLPHERPALVEVDEPLGLAAVAEGERALEHVAVGAGVARRGVGAGHAEHVGELAQEQLGVGALGAAGAGPLVDKGVEGRVVRHGRGVSPPGGYAPAGPARGVRAGLSRRAR